MNYISPDALPEVFHRLHLFVRPDGLLIFDIRTPEWLRALDGDIFVDEKDDVLCLWRADFDEELPAIVYGMDIFSRVGRLWERGCGLHRCAAPARLPAGRRRQNVHRRQKK